LGFFYILALDAREDFAVDAELAISAVAPVEDA